MEKIIKEWGNSLVIVFSPEERQILQIIKGDIVKIDIRKKEDHVYK